MFEQGFAFFIDRAPERLARDALDIFIVYYVCYRALLVLRGTRAMQVGAGLAAVFVLYLVARQLQLNSVISILGTLISSIILVIVVVFQNDIRRGLMRLGSTVPGLTRARASAVIDEVVDAATELARHRMGAIIAFEQDANLDEFVGVNKGRILDAAVSTELLVSLFVPEGVNKLHDGAVIIRELRIAKAGVFFPLPEGRMLDQSFGSRHRAALGITEETDAVVVVVSEERGTISYCFNGNIAPNLDGPRLRTLLESVFHPKPRKLKAKRGAAAATAAPVSTRIVAKEATSTPVAEEITLPLRTDPEVAALSKRESRTSVGETEPTRSTSQPPTPLRPRTGADGDPTPKSVRTPTPEARRSTTSQNPPPLRPRPKPEPETVKPAIEASPRPSESAPPAESGEPRRVLLTSRGPQPADPEPERVNPDTQKESSEA